MYILAPLCVFNVMQFQLHLNALILNQMRLSFSSQPDDDVRRLIAFCLSHTSLEFKLFIFGILLLHKNILIKFRIKCNKEENLRGFNK